MGTMKLQKVFGKIWIGPGDDVKQVCRHFMDPGRGSLDIDLYRGTAAYTILNVADDYAEMKHPRDMLYIHAGLNDAPRDSTPPYGEDNSLYAYLHAVKSLEFLENGPWDVMVHCHEGVSRSCFVVAVYIASLLGIPYSEAKVMLHTLYDRERIHPKHDPFGDEVAELMLRS